MVFKSDRQRKAVMAMMRAGTRADIKPTFKIIKIKGQAFVQRTVKTKKGTIIIRRRLI